MVDADYFLTVAHQAMWVFGLAAAPILIPALLSGLILGMVQAATSIQEQTLSFVPKLIVVGLSLIIFGAMILGLLSDFTTSIFERIPDLVH
jgi:flagellar biosynthetic protein FliQ